MIRRLSALDARNNDESRFAPTKRALIVGSGFLALVPLTEGPIAAVKKLAVYLAIGARSSVPVLHVGRTISGKGNREQISGKRHPLCRAACLAVVSHPLALRFREGGIG
jgi:hypothetical protein